MIKKIYKKIVPEGLRLKLRIFLLKCMSILYRGTKYHCTCCGRNFRKFLTKGNVKRENAMCPYCFSLERTRVLDLYLRSELNIYNKSSIKILHIAPERGIFLKLLKNKEIEYIDGDINPAYARNKIDITNIGYGDQYFDYIICSHVLGHIQNESKAIRELYRVLKSGGIAIIMTLLSGKYDTIEDETVIKENDRLSLYGEKDLCRLHGFDLNQRLKKEGFSVQMIDFRHTFTFEEQEKFRLGDGKRELIFECYKK